MKKTIAMFLVFVMALSLLAGCGNTKQEETQSGTTQAQQTEAGKEETQAENNEPKVLHIGTMSQWTGVDLSQLDSSFTSQELIIDSLVRIDENGNLQPNMASAVTQSEDGLTITVTIPDDLYFSTGEKLLPEDVKYSIERFLEISPMASQMEPLQSVEISGQDVILTFSSFATGVPVFLANTFISYVDKDVAEQSTKDDMLWGAKPYGLYYLDNYVEGASVTLKKNEYYKTNNELVTNKGVAYYDEIVVTFYADSFALLTAVNSGAEDVAFDCNSVADQFDTNNYSVILGTPNVTIHYLTMNTHDGILQDELVRKAVVYAVDREAMVADDGALTAEYSPLPYGLPNCSTQFAEEYKAAYGTDLNKAKELLTQAGWTDTDGDGYVDKDGQILELKYLCNDSDMSNNTAQTLLYSLKEIGVKLNIQAFANYGHYTNIAEGDYDISAQQFGWDEAGFIASMLMWCDTAVMENYANAEQLNTLVADLSGNPSADARTKDAYEVCKLLTEDLLLTPIYTENSFYAFNANAAGILDPAVGTYCFNDMAPQK